jgi:NADPH-dependent 2,4-dienoyl-CoA reductase/sulfur reductase-like enzyme
LARPNAFKVDRTLCHCVLYKLEATMGEYMNEKDARRPSVIIVGAGAGGVATAARLARAGCKVTVLEKNDFSGGRCSLIHRQGYVGKS